MRSTTRFFAPVGLLTLLLGALLLPRPAPAFYNVKAGDPVPADALPTLTGDEARLWVEGVDASVFVFFKPDQPNSVTALEAVAKLPEAMSGKKLHIVAVVSTTYEEEQIETALAKAGFEGPVMFDLDDEFYGKLGAVLTPAIGITSSEGKLVHYQAFHQLNLGRILQAHLQHHFGELDDEGLKRVLEPPKATQGGDGAIARRRVNMGRMLLMAKKLEKALKMADEAIEKDPEFVGGHALRAAVLAAGENCKGARASLKKAVALDPEHELVLQAQEACPEKAGGKKEAKAEPGAKAEPRAKPEEKPEAKAEEKPEAKAEEKAEEKPAE
ncbi:MAG: hypothetical protein P1V51_11480 [Deltaproteobacteria bacterium]|nr:hypothetical protein [Deltaproteobacteria bacterium]